MHTITDFLLRHRKATMIVFIALLLVSAVLSTQVKVNYDLAEYLPDDSMTKRAVSEMKDSFGYDGSAEVMAEAVTIPQALALKERIAAVDGVKSVLWLDDVADIAEPLEAMDAAAVAQFYKDEKALYQVTFDEFDYATSTGEAIEEIRALSPDTLRIAGTAEESRNMRAVLSKEIFTIFLVVVPFCLVILFAASSSWVEPPLYLAVLLVAILINTGTNFFFSGISFITHAMAAVLQLAISLDYSLFLFHRYLEERDSGKDAREAVLAATTKSLNSILASALTTIAGFLALVLMEYSIGRDIGYVLAKGIAISLLTVMTLMPVLIYLLRNVIDKTRHKRWMPSFGKLGRGTIKIRWVLILVLVIVIVPSYLAQQQNTFLYGDSSGSSSSGQIAEDKAAIRETFGVSNPVVLLVPSGDVATEVRLADALEGQAAVSGVQALVTLADPGLPRDMLPATLVDQFESERYSRMVVNLNVEGENDAVDRALDEVMASAEEAYPGTWMAAGTATSLRDIRQSVENDGMRVQLLSILAVALIVMLAFRSITVPVLLVALIQCAIWINMAVPYFSGTPLVYIGYLVISSLQLGATIDYAILLTNRYMEDRRTMPAREAAVAALTASGPSVLVSTLILAGAGYAEMLLSQIPSISAIGRLLGRGALLSGGMVLLVLPPMLALFDTALRAGTLKKKEIKG